MSFHRCNNARLVNWKSNRLPNHAATLKLLEQPRKRFHISADVFRGQQQLVNDIGLQARVLYDQRKDTKLNHFLKTEGGKTLRHTPVTHTLRMKSTENLTRWAGITPSFRVMACEKHDESNDDWKKRKNSLKIHRNAKSEGTSAYKTGKYAMARARTLNATRLLRETGTSLIRS